MVKEGKNIVDVDFHNPKSEVEVMGVDSCFLSCNGTQESCYVINFYALICVRLGHGTINIDGKNFPIIPNNVYMVMPGQKIFFYDDSNISAKAICFSQSIFYDAKGNEIVTFANEFYSSYTDKPFLNIPVQFKPALLNCLQMIEAESVGSDGYYAHRSVLQHLLQLFLILMRRDYFTAENEFKISQSNSDDQLTASFNRQVLLHYHEHWSVTRYAELLKVSVPKLNAAVKTSSGKSPMQSIAERVIIESKRLLTYTNCPITQIASQLGFDHTSNFNAYFRTHVKMLPSEYRRQALKALYSENSSQ